MLNSLRAPGDGLVGQRSDLGHDLSEVQAEDFLVAAKGLLVVDQHKYLSAHLAADEEGADGGFQGCRVATEIFDGVVNGRN